jgi:hypothetical protein
MQSMVAIFTFLFKLRRLLQVVGIPVALVLFAWPPPDVVGQALEAFVIDVEQGCELVSPAQCQGGVRKFSIDGTGVWTVEFREPGQSYSGQLQGNDMTALRLAVEQLFAKGDPRARTCAPRPTPPETPETVSIKRPDLEIVLHGSGGKLDPLCGRPGSAADQIFSLADRIMRKVLSKGK